MKNETNQAAAAVTAAQHTPGPWVVFAGTAIIRADKDEYGNNRRIAKVPETDEFQASSTDDPFSETRANARLIAAAPELLAALDDMLAWAQIPDGASKDATLIRNRSRAAIAKATGGAL